MSVLKVKKNGVWEDVVAPEGHTHTVSDITDFPAGMDGTDQVARDAAAAAQETADSKVSKTGDTMTGALTVQQLNTKGGTVSRLQYMDADGNTIARASVQHSTHRFQVSEFCTDDLNRYETYYLPTPDTGLTASKTYNILTTKSTVTVAQGGTGATTAAAALTNLGAMGTAGGTFTGTVTMPSNSAISGSQYVNLKFVNSADGSLCGLLAGSVSNRRLYVVSYASDTSYKENYNFPKADTGLTSDKNYNILTSKTAVTVAQGGTGATTAAAALTNLGAMPASGGEFTGYVSFAHFSTACFSFSFLASISKSLMYQGY